MNTQQKLNKLRTLALKLMLTQKEIEDLVAVLRSPDMDGYCEASWSEVKQTTSHRPESPASEGNRFSKTTTSYEESGISLRRSPVEGHRGHSSAGG